MGKGGMEVLNEALKKEIGCTAHNTMICWHKKMPNKQLITCSSRRYRIISALLSERGQTRLCRIVS